MSRSLSWIEKSALDKRFSELTRPVGYPVPEPASELPTAEEIEAISPTATAAAPSPATAETPATHEAPAPHERPTENEPGHAGPAHAEPTSSDSAANVVSPPAADADVDGAGPIPDAEDGLPPIPANQDPWTMTPAQPWSSLANPTNDRATPGIPELTYPRVMALAARLELFRDWIRQYCGEGAFFVADAEGLPLLLDRVRTSQAVTAVALERALRPLRGLLGSSKANSLCIELEDGRLVQTIWAVTPAGRIAVGMAPSRPLGPAATAQVRRALLGLFTDEET